MRIRNNVLHKTQDAYPGCVQNLLLGLSRGLVFEPQVERLQVGNVHVCVVHVPRFDARVRGKGGFGKIKRKCIWVLRAWFYYNVVLVVVGAVEMGVRKQRQSAE